MSKSKTAASSQIKAKKTGRVALLSGSVEERCEEIRKAAYRKWEAAGCPCGDGAGFWLQAEADLSIRTESNRAGL